MAVFNKRATTILPLISEMKKRKDKTGQGGINEEKNDYTFLTFL